MLRFAPLAGAAALALSAAACTPSQEQQVLTGLNAACASLAVGTTIAVEVAAVVPGAGGASAIANTVGTVSGTACTALVPAVKGIVDNIVASGATAQVTAVTTDPATGLKVRRRMQVTPGGQVIFNGVITPDPGFRF